MLYYENEFTLLESDFDFNDNIKISSYLDLFQTVAGEHAKRMGIGFKPTIEKGLVWVITKIKFDVFAPLHSSDRIRVATTPLPKGTLDYVRDYYIYNDKGELVAIGSSQWVLIDYKTRRISRAVIEYDGECTDKSAYENRRIEKVSVDGGEKRYTHTVTPLDLDHNGHVNNIRYADMAFCACHEENRPVKRAIFNFSSECRLGDTVEVFVKTEGDVTLVLGKRANEVSFTARIEY